MRHLLGVFLYLPESYEKSAHMLLLAELAKQGWKSTVLCVTPGVLSDPNTKRADNCEEIESEWRPGVVIRRLKPMSVRWRFSESWRRARFDLTTKGAKGQFSIGTRRLQSPRLHNGVARAMKLFTPAVCFPDRYAPAIGQVVQEALSLHDRDPVDVAASLYYPFSSHLVARRVVKKTRLPWVAMTKDFYSWPPEMVRRGPRCWGGCWGAKNLFKRRWERNVLRPASSLLAVNDNITAHLRRLLPEVPAQTLTHCFDEDSLAPANPAAGVGNNDGHFRLVSVGKVDHSERAGLNLFFEALSEFLRESGWIPHRQPQGARGDVQKTSGANGASGHTIRVRFVGLGGKIVADCARRFGCSEVLELSPQVPHQQAIREMRQATCLLFQQAPWGNRRRLAEYFAARKPILAFPEYPGVMSQQLLRQYQAAWIAPNKAAIKAALTKWRQEYSRAGRLEAPVNEALIEQFSARRLAAELAGVLEDVLEAKASYWPAGKNMPMNEGGFIK